MTLEDVKKISEEHQNILASVQELRKEKVALVDNNKALKAEYEDFKKQFEIVKTAANKQINDCLQEAKEKSGAAENILQEAKRREAGLSSWEKGLQDMSTALINGQKDLAERTKSLDSEFKEKETSLAAREQKFIEETHIPVGRLVIENDRVEKLAASLKIENEHREKEIEVQQNILNQVEILAGEVKKTKRENEDTLKKITEQNSQNLETLAKILALKTDVETKTNQLAEGVKKLAQAESALDLRRREVEVLDKRVQQLIKVKGLEAELGPHVG